MVYIIASLFNKMKKKRDQLVYGALDVMWMQLILTPDDYADSAIHDPELRKQFDLINFKHGGPDYDEKYPKGIPTRVVINTPDRSYDSGMVMFPVGHSGNTTCDLRSIL